MDGASELYTFAPAGVLLVMCTEKLYEGFCSTPAEQRSSFADAVMARIRTYWELISGHINTRILQFTFAYMNDGSMGSYALRECASFTFQLTKLNFLLSQAASERKDVFLVDINAVQGMIGAQRFKDDKLYYVAKMPFSLEALPYIAASSASFPRI